MKRNTPKGLLGNPYTMEEYDSFEEGKFPGGFVGTGPGEATYYKADEGYGAGGSGSGSGSIFFMHFALQE